MNDVVQPLGFRNNNPGNMRPGRVPWNGQLGVDAHGYLIFDTMEHGVRAMAKQLLAYYQKRGLDTIRKMIGRWAPAGGADMNNTDAYVAAVSRSMGVGPDVLLSPTEVETMQPLCAAMIHQENGQSLAPEIVTAGVCDALGI
jgi:hypothetical protein